MSSSPSAVAAAAAPFLFEGDARGVLLVHGFTGTPFEMRLLGEDLAAAGFTVSGPVLAGHGVSAEALARTGWTDWYASVEAAFDALRARLPSGARVAVVGQSLGGLLCLELARRRSGDVAAVGSLATPLWLGPWPERGIRWMQRAGRFAPRILPKLAGSDIADPLMRRRNPATRGMPVSSLGSLVEIMGHVRARLGEVHRPTFVAHARQDHTAPFDCMAALVAGLGTREVDQLVLERSFHCITIDVERDVLATRLEAFLARHLAAASPSAAE